MAADRMDEIALANYVDELEANQDPEKDELIFTCDLSPIDAELVNIELRRRELHIAVASATSEEINEMVLEIVQARRRMEDDDDDDEW